MNIPKSVIIVAGGSGSRMKSEIPKQFLVLKDIPILMHTIECFQRFDNDMQIVVVLPKEQFAYWFQLCKDYKFEINHDVAAGGSTRFHSVKNGLSHVKHNGLVGVHDGVRPLVSEQTLRNTYTLAAENKCVVPVIDVFESVRFCEADKNNSVDRNKYKLVQTPQVFPVEILRKGYEQEYKAMFTDDASVCELAGFEIFLTKGNRENIKVTTPIDLIMAEAFLKC